MDQHLQSRQQNALSGVRETVEQRAAATEGVDRLDREVESKVLAARSCGASWSAIASVLGTSKQAAWERYGHREQQGVA